LFFGYYGNGFRGWGDGLTPTLPYTNLHWLMPDEHLAADLQRCQDLGHKAVVVITSLVFQHPSSALHPDASERLRTWWLNLANREAIAALLIFDEPWMHNGTAGLPFPQVGVNINAGAAIVKGVTGCNTLVTAEGKEYDLNGVPHGPDWIGMYRYSYNTWPWELYTSFDKLTRRKAPHQRIMVVADAYEKLNKPIAQWRINLFNSTWRYLIKGRRDVVAVCPFMYQTSAMGQGADRMPAVRAAIADWARQLRAVA
jgi:hypothetical protein